MPLPLIGHAGAVLWPLMPGGHPLPLPHRKIVGSPDQLWPRYAANATHPQPQVSRYYPFPSLQTAECIKGDINLHKVDKLHNFIFPQLWVTDGCFRFSTGIMGPY